MSVVLKREDGRLQATINIVSASLVFFSKCAGFGFTVFFFIPLGYLLQIISSSLISTMYMYILICAILFRVASCQTVSIQDIPAFTSQRPCALNCISGLNGEPEILAEDMGCAYSPIENECFCRPDLQGTAESIVRQCVNNYCQNTLDVNSAVSIYDAYCTGLGSTRAAGAVTTSATGKPKPELPLWQWSRGRRP